MRCIQRLTALPIAKPQMAGTDQITQRRNGSLFCPCSVTFACVGCAALSKLWPFSLATLSSTAAAVVAVGASASSSWKCAKLRPLENIGAFARGAWRRESRLTFGFCNFWNRLTSWDRKRADSTMKDHTLKE